MTYYVAGIAYGNDLYHFGIKGQRWGIRRFQNPDGTRTEAGKARYNSDGISDSSRNRERLKKVAKGVAIAAGTAALGYGAYRLAKSGALNGVAENMRNSRADRRERNRINSERVRDAFRAGSMSNEELKEKIGRLKLEQELRNLTSESVSYTQSPAEKMVREAGEKVLKTALAGIGGYAIRYAFTRKFNPNEAADYISPRPKKK